MIAKYEVTAEDQSAITNQILLIVLDIMGKLNQTWYVIWNDTVKPALNHIHQTRKAAEVNLSLPGGVPLVLEWIPAGNFMMGSPTDEVGGNGGRYGKLRLCNGIREINVTRKQ